jgi:pimeloyl-ACP methyl ester carboxylesterase
MDPLPFCLEREGFALAGEQLAGEGTGGGTILLLHGLTATRRYVLHGSRHLPRHGLGLVGYDARGHGVSGVAPAGSYGYDALADDAAAVIAARMGEGRPVLAGHSMGAHTAVALALRDRGRIAGLVLIGPAALGTPPPDEALAYWDRLAEGLEQGGVEGFVAAYDHDLPPQWREPALRITRQRLEAHEHPEGVARALREVPRSVPFEGMSELAFLDLPALVVASHDDADPSHPYTVAEAWAEALPRARLVSEDPGQSPLPWQGGRLSREIAAFCAEDAVRERR